MSEENKNLSSGNPSIADLKISEALIDQIINSVDRSISEKQITAMNIFSICILVMQLAEQTLLKGKDKKELVLEVMNRLIKKYGGDSGLLAVLPSFIDQTISVDRGEVAIHISPEQVATCCMGLFKK